MFSVFCVHFGTAPRGIDIHTSSLLLLRDPYTCGKEFTSGAKTMMYYDLFKQLKLLESELKLARALLVGF